MAQSLPRKLVVSLTTAYRWKFLPLFLRAVLRPAPSSGLVRLGTHYGGWWLPASSLKPGAVAYCAGAGEDISFDLELFNAGLEVIVFDPTPRAIEHVNQVAPKDPRFRFVPVGWWNSTTSLKFFAPQDTAHVSHSAVNLQQTDSYFTAEVTTVAEFAAKLGHPVIEIVKMDIEGAEHVVLADLVEHGPRPTTLLVEFDQPDKVSHTISTVRMLEREGYRLRHIDVWNYSFSLVDQS